MEKNFGGEMAEDVVKNAMRVMGVKPTAIKVEPVSASRGKKVRAEPIAQLYGDPDDPKTWASSETHHVGTFEELEDQLTTWLPESGESPDRMDGMVWAATRLLIVEEDESGFFWEADYVDGGSTSDSTRSISSASSSTPSATMRRIPRMSSVVRSFD